MKLLLDTNVLLFVAIWPERLSAAARAALDEAAGGIAFSPVSIFEVALKFMQGKPSFPIDPRLMRHSFLEAGYIESVLTARHAAAVADLPKLHGDPFDRLLLAQARVEGIPLLTVDKKLAAYPAPVRLV